MDRCALAYAVSQGGLQLCPGGGGRLRGPDWALTPEQLVAAMSGFGGGVGGSHEELCGAVSGGVLVLSLLHPHTDGDGQGRQGAVYAQGQGVPPPV